MRRMSLHAAVPLCPAPSGRCAHRHLTMAQRNPPLLPPGCPRSTHQETHVLLCSHNALPSTVRQVWRRWRTPQHMFSPVVTTCRRISSRPSRSSSRTSSLAASSACSRSASMFLRASTSAASCSLTAASSAPSAASCKPCAPAVSWAACSCCCSRSRSASAGHSREQGQIG